MPVYDYACPDCGLAFEVSRSFSESDKPAMCPMCNVEARRQISLPMATYTRGGYAEKAKSRPSSPASNSKWSHSGHSHGSGTGSHSH